MSIDKSVVRTSIIPSLLNVYDYNKKRKVKDILLYEVAKTYDKSYNEESKIAGLLSGNYISNGWNFAKKVDFYVVKGIVEDLLDYMGFKNRYSFTAGGVDDLHPGISAKILLDKKEIGIIGRVHPKILKDEVYVFEISLQALMTEIKPLKYKEAPKYPSMEKDMAFILDKSIEAGKVIDIIKKAGGRILSDVTVFDVYEGENIDNSKKSIAFKLNFMDINRTLNEEEVMQSFKKIIEKVESEFQAKLRDQ